MAAASPADRSGDTVLRGADRNGASRPRPYVREAAACEQRDERHHRMTQPRTAAAWSGRDDGQIRTHGKGEPEPAAERTRHDPQRVEAGEEIRREDEQQG